jgi:hypothetical protein
MKFIKQKSTNKIVYRESPHTDKTIDNAVMDTGILESDLEVVEENWTNDEWTVAMNNQLPYSDKRKSEYPTIEECVHAILDGELDDLQIKRQAVKDKYPKGDN